MKSWIRSRFAAVLRRLGAAILLGLAGTAAHGADYPVLRAPSPPLSAWQFQATAYGWATAINGEVGVRNLPPVDFNADFLDVLKRLDGAFMGSFLAKNGEWMVMTDLVWAKLSDDALVKLPGTRRPVLAALLPGTHVELGLRQLIASGIAGYRLPFVSPDVELYATAGVRYQRLTAHSRRPPA